MSFSLAIEDGDLQLKGSSVAIVHGVDKLYQDLSIWLREPFRVDRFHITFGSVLDSYIGSVIDRSTTYEVRAEVMRVLQNYQAKQLEVYKKQPDRLSLDEILMDIDNIDVRLSYDSVIVNILFRTAKGTTGSVTIDSALN